ncbi:MAG: hypothetical protein WC911_02145 [Thermoleophilia bacterium]
MTPDPRLLNHPKVREEAERRAVEFFQALIDTCDVARKYAREWEDVEEDIRKNWIDASTRLLSDPTRPETRDWLVRSGMEWDKRWSHRYKGPDHFSNTAIYVRFPDGQEKWMGEGWYEQDIEHFLPDAKRSYWLALRDNPEALVSEWLAVNP